MTNSIGLGGAVVFALVAVLLHAGTCLAKDGEIKLTAKDLYNGFDARKVLLDERGEKLQLDARVFKFGKDRQGVIVTDPIDLGAALPAAGIVGLDGRAEEARIQLDQAVPQGAKIAVEYRNGSNSLDAAEWSSWQAALDAEEAKAGAPRRLSAVKPTARYLQLRLTLTAKDEKGLPSVSSLTVQTTFKPAAAWAGKLTVTEDKIQKIVRSPIEFVYERPDSPKLAKFRKAAKLDEVVAGGKDDFEKLVKLMDLVCSFRDVRDSGRERKGGFYQWDIDAVFEVKDGKPTVYGHCMTYSEVLVTAATAMGYVGSRHMAMAGYQDKSHEVCDIWVPSLGKWVYFDPSCDHYYTDKKTKEKMNLIELHQVVAEKLVPEGKDMNWWVERPNPESKALMSGGLGRTVVDCRMGPWHYGDPQDPDYDWGTLHGYVCTGFVQMTPRNDFNSNPKAMSKRFEHEPGYDGYPLWADAKTPPRGANWFTRMRDFYWTMDQASLKLVQGDEGTLMVELGQSMPFFKNYRVRIDPGHTETKEAAGPVIWKLQRGDNELEVAPVDEFGKVGLTSSVTVNYAK